MKKLSESAEDVMDYSIVFTDIDGTLLNSAHQVTEATAAGIRALDRAGIPVVFVSARMPMAIYPLQEQIGFHAPIICYSGALTLDRDGKPVKSICLSAETVEAMKRLLPAETEECCFCSYVDNRWIVSNPEHVQIRSEHRITGADPEMGDPFMPGRAVHKILGFGPQALLNETMRKLKQAFPECTIVKSAPHLLEIMDGKVSKADALVDLCKKMGISEDKAAAFGDNYNDLEMLQSAGLGIAMGNAPEEVKQAADEVTLDNDHDGLLAALRRLFPEGGSF